MEVTGRVRLGKKTKTLLKRLKTGEIAVVDHRDLDRVNASSLAQIRVKALINAASSISGEYPAEGAVILLEAGIPIVDEAGSEIFEELKDGEMVRIVGGRIFRNGTMLKEGVLLDLTSARKKAEDAASSMSERLEQFALNTMEYLRKEKSLLFRSVSLPDLKTSFQGKHALIVVRGTHYREDLRAIKRYIEEVRPVLVGVDGGGDALLEEGYVPHLIVGDMDSVSDEALRSGAEMVVHAYPDGTAPGMKRIAHLGLSASTLPVEGLSEDAAMLLACEKGAQLIVAVGSHFSLIDFLERNRPGMASTFLMRMRLGDRLVDARGVSELYKTHSSLPWILRLVLAAAAPVALILLLSPAMKSLFKIFLLKLRLLF